MDTTYGIFGYKDGEKYALCFDMNSLQGSFIKVGCPLQWVYSSTNMSLVEQKLYQYRLLNSWVAYDKKIEPVNTYEYVDLTQPIQEYCIYKGKRSYLTALKSCINYSWDDWDMNLAVGFPMSNGITFNTFAKALTFLETRLNDKDRKDARIGLSKEGPSKSWKN